MLSLRFRVFMLLAIAGALIGLYETAPFVNDWPVDQIGVGIAAIAFPIGLVGTAAMWRKETRNSYRAAIRRQRGR